MSILHHAGSAVEYPFSRDVSELAQACIQSKKDWMYGARAQPSSETSRVTWSNVRVPHDRFQFGLHVGKAH